MIATYRDKYVVIDDGYHYKQYLKKLGFVWDSKMKAWKLLADVGAFRALKELRTTFAVPVIIDSRLKRYKERLAQLLRMKIDYSSFQPTKPSMEHQIDSTLLILKAKRAGIFNDTGTGKTKIAVDAIEFLINNGYIRNVLIITPKHLIKKWKREIAKFTKLDPESIDIINYEFFSRNPDFNITYDMIVLDEATYIKNPKAKRTQTIWKLGAGVPFKVVLTATPTTQSIEDLWSIMFFLDGGKRLGTSFSAFRDKYMHKREVRRRDGSKFVKYIPIKRLIGEITENISDITVAYTKDVIKDLPSKLYDERPLEPTKEMLDYHHMVKKGIFISGEDKLYRIKNTIIRLHQITSGFVYDPDKDRYIIFKNNPKLEALKEILEEEVRGKKVLIWRTFVIETGLIKEVVHKAGLKPLILDAKTKDPAAVLDEFHNKDDRVIIASPFSHKYGHEIFADVIIFYSNSFSVETRKQAEDRSHRYGSVRSPLYIDLYYEGMMDDYVLKSLKRNIDVLDTTISNLRRALI